MGATCRWLRATRPAGDLAGSRAAVDRAGTHARACLFEKRLRHRERVQTSERWGRCGRSGVPMRRHHRGDLRDLEASARCMRWRSRACAAERCWHQYLEPDAGDAGGDAARPGTLRRLHFFNPVAQMSLVEVVHSASTRPEALAQRWHLPAHRQAAAALRSSPASCHRVLFPYFTRRCTRRRRHCVCPIDRAAVDSHAMAR